jgi:hypothetical protein
VLCAPTDQANENNKIMTNKNGNAPAPALALT